MTDPNPNPDPDQAIVQLLAKLYQAHAKMTALYLQETLDPRCTPKMWQQSRVPLQKRKEELKELERRVQACPDLPKSKLYIERNKR